MSKVEESLTNRRDFIKVSSGALVIATLGTADLRAASPENIPLASVGFWPGVPKAARRFKSPAAPYLVPAASILAGDPAFFSAGARAFVRGLWRPQSTRNQAAAFALDVMYDVEGQKVPFHAWSFASRSLDSNAFRSNNLAFNVPIDALGTLDLVLSTPEGAKSIRFSVNSAPDTLKLRAGYYFVALPEGQQGQAIDWTRIRIREDAVPYEFESDGAGVLTTGGFGEETAVSFSYLVVFVAVGSQPSARQE